MAFGDQLIESYVAGQTVFQRIGIFVDQGTGEISTHDINLYEDQVEEIDLIDIVTDTGGISDSLRNRLRDLANTPSLFPVTIFATAPAPMLDANKYLIGTQADRMHDTEILLIDNDPTEPVDPPDDYHHMFDSRNIGSRLNVFYDEDMGEVKLSMKVPERPPAGGAYTDQQQKQLLPYLFRHQSGADGDIPSRFDLGVYKLALEKSTIDANLAPFTGTGAEPNITFVFPDTTTIAGTEYYIIGEVHVDTPCIGHGEITIMPPGATMPITQIPLTVEDATPEGAFTCTITF